MFHLRLEALRETLLCAGIAPRHVRRYLRELHQHFDDLVRAETENGLSGNAAFDAARTRLGPDDELAAAMLARPELRSVSARYPWAVFGIGSVLFLSSSLFFATLMEVGLIKLHKLFVGEAAGRVPPDWLQSLFVAWDVAMMYVFPVGVAALLCFFGMRQRIKTGWIALAVIVVLFLGATVQVATTWSPIPLHSEFNVSAGVITSESWPRFLVNLGLAALMVASQWWFTRRRESETAE